jgi:hypothetical protein
MYILAILYTYTVFHQHQIEQLYNQKSENIDFKGLAEVINK